MKYCKICKKTIYGRARKYCPECRRIVHKQQMNKNYRENKNDWKPGGKYYNKQSERNKNVSWMYNYIYNQKK